MKELSKEVITKKIGHKVDIIIKTNYMDNFGKEYSENKLWDNVLTCDVPLQVEVAKKYAGLEYIKQGDLL